jgi:hypothetical protein
MCQEDMKKINLNVEGNVFNVSSISTFFVSLDAPKKELQSLFQCLKQWSNIQRVSTKKHKLNHYV